jgi:cation diffusion facilitator CzcD-associated flavoprotein CzcO
MPNSYQHDVVIVGTGIGGLALALALRRHGTARQCGSMRLPRSCVPLESA